MQLRLRLSGWRICAHCKTISGSRMRRWRPNRWPTRRPFIASIAGAGAVDVALPLLHAARLPAGYGPFCFGGGRLGQRLHVVKLVVDLF
jgi:hypothetical protein